MTTHVMELIDELQGELRRKHDVCATEALLSQGAWERAMECMGYSLLPVSVRPRQRFVGRGLQCIHDTCLPEGVDVVVRGGGHMVWETLPTDPYAEPYKCNVCGLGRSPGRGCTHCVAEPQFGVDGVVRQPNSIAFRAARPSGSSIELHADGGITMRSSGGASISIGPTSTNLEKILANHTREFNRMVVSVAGSPDGTTSKGYPLHRVTDGRGIKRGPRWERFTRELASMLERHNCKPVPESIQFEHIVACIDKACED